MNSGHSYSKKITDFPQAMDISCSVAFLCRFSPQLSLELFRNPPPYLFLSALYMKESSLTQYIFPTFSVCHLHLGLVCSICATQKFLYYQSIDHFPLRLLSFIL